jgi:hypothetical protein
MRHPLVLLVALTSLFAIASHGASIKSAFAQDGTPKVTSGRLALPRNFSIPGASLADQLKLKNCHCEGLFCSCAKINLDGSATMMTIEKNTLDSLKAGAPLF